MFFGGFGTLLGRRGPLSMLSLAHIRSSYKGTESPWEAEAKEKRMSKKNKNVSSGGGAGGGSNCSSRSAYFASMAAGAKSRQAHPGGKMSSNKVEATYKFLVKKQARGESLTENELSVVRKFMGPQSEALEELAEGKEVSSALLERLHRKAEAERRERNRGGGGGGSNKDCRSIDASAAKRSRGQKRNEHRGRAKAHAKAIKARGKMGKVVVASKKNKNVKKINSSRAGNKKKVRSDSIEALLNKPLGAGR